MNKKALLFLIVLISAIILSSCSMAASINTGEDGITEEKNSKVLFDWTLSDKQLKDEVQSFFYEEWGIHYTDETLLEKNLSKGGCTDVFCYFSPSDATFDTSLNVEAADYPWNEQYYSASEQTKMYAKNSVYQLRAQCNFMLGWGYEGVPYVLDAIINASSQSKLQLEFLLSKKVLQGYFDILFGKELLDSFKIDGVHGLNEEKARFEEVQNFLMKSDEAYNNKSIKYFQIFKLYGVFDMGQEEVSYITSDKIYYKVGAYPKNPYEAMKIYSIMDKIYTKLRKAEYINNWDLNDDALAKEMCSMIHSLGIEAVPHILRYVYNMSTAEKTDEYGSHDVENREYLLRYWFYADKLDISKLSKSQLKYILSPEQLTIEQKRPNIFILDCVSEMLDCSEIGKEIKTYEYSQNRIDQCLSSAIDKEYVKVIWNYLQKDGAKYAPVE